MFLSYFKSAKEWGFFGILRKLVLQNLFHSNVIPLPVAHRFGVWVFICQLPFGTVSVRMAWRLLMALYMVCVCVCLRGGGMVMRCCASRI